jgi:hypothetical protein
MSCSILQAEAFGAWCPDLEGSIRDENTVREVLRRARRPLPVPVAYEVAKTQTVSHELLSLKVASAGSRLESLGLWLMQLVATLAIVEVLVHRQVIAPRILIGLFIVGFAYWITILEMRRKARADLGI